MGLRIGGPPIGAARIPPHQWGERLWPIERNRQSAVLRAKPEGMRRNVCVALGNIADATTVGPLTRVLRDDASPLVRGHAAWALGRIGTVDAVEALEAASLAERDSSALEEIAAALGEAG